MRAASEAIAAALQEETAQVLVLIPEIALTQAGIRVPTRCLAVPDRFVDHGNPEALRGATFTLSNFGMMAGRYATPVVVPPTIAILGSGGLRHDVVPVLGGIETHPRIPLSLTFDHRCVTGGEACRFLAAVISDLRQPS